MADVPIGDAAPTTPAGDVPMPDAATPPPVTPVSPASPLNATDPYGRCSVGIDLGNLFVRMACMAPEQQMPSIVRNASSNEQTPAVVAFREGKERTMGDDAAGQVTSYPQSAVNHLKTIQGLRLTKDVALAHGLHFRINSDANSIDLPLDSAAELTPFSATQVLAMLLRRVLLFCSKSSAAGPAASSSSSSSSSSSTADVLIRLPQTVVIAVPVYFSPEQRGAVRDALHIALMSCFANDAGVVPKIVVVSDAVANVLCYHHSHYSELHSSEPKTVALVDVGHSQSSVTLFKVTKTKIEIVESVGQNGGSMLVDQALANDALTFLKTKKNVDVSSRPKALARIYKEAMKCKEILSALDKGQITVEALTEDVDLQHPVDRPTLHGHADKLGDVLAALSQKVFESAKKQFGAEWAPATSVDKLEIIGGGMRMPYLQERLKAVWEKPISTTMDSSLSTAQGCSLLGIIKDPTPDTHRILGSIVSKVDEARRILETIHFVELVCPAHGTEGLPGLDPKEILRLTQVERDLETRDQVFIAIATARNSLEEYIYWMRGLIETPEMQKAVSASDRSAIAELLATAETWLGDHEAEGAATPEPFVTYLATLKKDIETKFPSISQELERQAVEKAKKDAEWAEEARKAQLETKKEPRTNAERIRFAEEYKEKGNQLFKQEHHQEAMTRYVQALAYTMDLVQPDDDEQKKKREDIKFSCYLNIAAAATKLNYLQKAIDNCNKAIELQPDSAKAHFRKGQALSLKSEWADAKKALETALSKAPEDKAIQKELTLLAKKVEQHKEKEKKMFAGMFK